MDKIKVAHVQLLPLLTGVQNVTLSELSRLDTSSYEKHLICKEKGPLTTKCNEMEVQVHICPTLKRNISLIDDIRSFIWLYKHFRTYKYDVVHTHSSKTGVLGRLAAKLAGISMVVHTVHGFAFPAADSNLMRFLYIFLEFVGAKCSDKIICLHEVDRQICIDTLKAKPSQLEIFPNGVDFDVYSPGTQDQVRTLRAKESFNDGSLVVGMIGRLWHQKNPQAFLNSAQEILKNRTDVTFIFIGDGELKEHLESSLNENEKDNIKFLGWSNNTAEWLKIFDVFVLPSLWEGMPLAIIEALSTGVPCIVSDIPGNNHLVADGKNGFLFPLAKPDELTEKILLLLDNDELRFKMAQTAYLNATERFDIDKRVEKISNLYVNFLS